MIDDSARVWRMSGLTRDGTGWPNPSRETKFSGANEDRGKNIILFISDHEQDWQPYPVDPYHTAESTDHKYILVIVKTYEYQLNANPARGVVTRRYDEGQRVTPPSS